MPLGSLWTWEGLKDQLLEKALLWKRVNKGPLRPSCWLRPFDAAEDAGSRQRPGWGTGPHRAQALVMAYKPVAASRRVQLLTFWEPS